MGIRETMNESKKLGVGIAIAVVVVGVALVVVQLLSGRETGAAPIINTAFYTDDNGKTFFKDDVNKIVPFDHNGKQAYRADVFQGADGKQFVGLVYRHTSAGRQEIENYFAKNSKDGMARSLLEHRDMQVKRVGADDASWVLNDSEATESLQASVHDASGKPAKLVTP